MTEKVTHDLIQHKQYHTNDTEWVVKSRCYPYMTCSPIGSSSAKWTAITGRCECNSTAFPPKAIKTGHWTDFQLIVNCMLHCLYNSASSSTLHVRQNMPLAWAKTILNKFSVLWARCSSDILHCWPFILIRYLLLHSVTPGALVENGTLKDTTSVFMMHMGCTAINAAIDAKHYLSLHFVCFGSSHTWSWLTCLCGVKDLECDGLSSCPMKTQHTTRTHCFTLKNICIWDVSQPEI